MAAVPVAENLKRVRERIAAACHGAGRPTDSVRLIAVTKRIPIPLVVEACRAGQRDLGENRVQDALPRQAELAAALLAAGLAPQRVAWHFIGHLQRNKAKRVVGQFGLLHGVDSAALAATLSRHALAGRTSQSILLEINISGEDQKNGLAPAALPDVAAGVATLPGLDLVGLMGMARRGAAPGELGRTFARLRVMAEAVRRETGLPLPELSMGMSADFEIAIAEGATTVRVGSAIFGPRTA